MAANWTKRRQGEIEAAIREHHGLLHMACRALKISYQTLLNYRKRWPELGQIIDEEKGLLLDVAELSLFKAIRDGDLGAVKFALATIGKDRGYTEAIQHSGKVAIVVEDLTDEELSAIAANRECGRRRAAPPARGKKKPA